MQNSEAQIAGHLGPALAPSFGRSLAKFRAATMALTTASTAFTAVAGGLLLASYPMFLWGSSAVLFSLALSLFLASVAFGAILGAKRAGSPISVLLSVKLSSAILTTIALPILYFALARGFFPRFLWIGLVIATGLSLGGELPLLKRPGEIARKISGLDFFTGFIAGVAFPSWLLPQLGLFRVAGLLGSLHSLLALAILASHTEELKTRRGQWIAVAISAVLFTLGFLGFPEPIRHTLESHLFPIQSISR